jgi:MFS family permease
MNTRLKARFATFTLFFSLGYAFASWASRIPDVQQRLHLGVADLGSVLLGMPIGSLVSVLLTGWVIGRLGSKRVSLLSAVLSAISLVWLGQATSAVELAAALFFFGAADNVLNIAMNTQAIGVEAMYGRTLMSAFHGVWSIGAMVGAAAGGWLASGGIITSVHFVGSAGVMLALVFGVSPWLIKADSKSEGKQVVFALPDRSLLVLSIIGFCCMMTEGAMADWSSLYYKSVLSDPEASPTLGYTAFALVMAVGRFTGDRLTQRVGVQTMLYASGALIALGLSLALLLPISWIVVVGFGMVGAGVATVVPIVYSAAGRSSTMSAGMALAAVSTVGYTGFLFGPPIIGYLAELTSLRVSLGMVILLGCLVMVFTRRIK